MYWLYGAPSIFAATKHHGPPTTSHDGICPDGSENDGLAGSSEAAQTSADVAGLGVKAENGHNRTDSGACGTAKDHSSPENQQPDGLGGRPLQSTGEEIIGLRISRNGYMFATVTRSTLTIWQTKPTVAVSSIVRSQQSLENYGPNVQILLRPDSAILVVQTTRGYLITYSLVADPDAHVYNYAFPDTTHGHSRHKSFSGKAHRNDEDVAGPGEAGGVRQVSIQFRMAIKVDAGISQVIAQDDELVVATTKPAALQCIRWTPDTAGSQTSTELLKSMSWLGRRVSIVEMIYDRPMNLSCWITSDGKAYAVQRVSRAQRDTTSAGASQLFRGYGFHVPGAGQAFATKAAICARFSLLAVGCADGGIRVYTAKDYSGHIPLSFTLSPPASLATTGPLAFLSYSPDGYCLFAGYGGGWAMWSVYGRPGASSFSTDCAAATANDERWLLGVRDGIWIGGGSQLLLLGRNDNKLWMLDMARSAVAGCFSPANVARLLLQTSTGFVVYQGHDVADSHAEHGLWHHVQVPSSYLAHHWPIRSAVTSADGKYVAIAGRRGLAHYSAHSGRWKVFDDPVAENDFTVRGGMCWHQHVLIAAVETAETHEIRVYSRDAALSDSSVMHVEHLPAPIILLSPSGEDSLLVYTYDNQLYHFIISATSSAVKLIQVGQIGFHGIIRAPARVRALSWVLPEEQLADSDPTQDVALATVVFLVDGKLVLLQPSTKESGDLKYDMRIIASNVEYYALIRDQHHFRPSASETMTTMQGLPPALSGDGAYPNDLQDSLWYFDGVDMRVWTDVQDVLASTSTSEDISRELPTPIQISVDFYPLSVLLSKGLLFGVETEMVQRRDVSFTFSKFVARTHLFLPPILRHHLSQYNTPGALYLSHNYQHLPYFAHALEILLHDILDDEVDKPPETAEAALLPAVLSFLSSFPQFLDIVVQCTRKTEVRSWRTLFNHLPPPRDLFESALQESRLKTAGGYLLVLNTLEESGLLSPVGEPGEGGGPIIEREREDQVVRLLRQAREQGDFELCKELARFLMALDSSGRMLENALGQVGLLRGQANANHAVIGSSFTLSNGVGLGIGAVPVGRTERLSKAPSPRGSD